MKDIPDQSIDMILCDLPYGTTACKWDTIIPFEPLWAQYKRITKDNAAIVLTASQPFTTSLILSCKELFRYDLVWNKSITLGFFNANKMPLRVHETICVFYKNLPTYNPQKTKSNGSARIRQYKTKDRYEGYGSDRGDTLSRDYGMRFPTSIIDISNHNHGGFYPALPDEKSKHPTQKPIPLFEYLIRTYTHEGDLVLDNCIGSGTTAIACINTGRNFIGIEKDPDYFEIASKRIKKAKEQKRLF